MTKCNTLSKTSKSTASRRPEKGYTIRQLKSLKTVIGSHNTDIRITNKENSDNCYCCDDDGGGNAIKTDTLRNGKPLEVFMHTGKPAMDSSAPVFGSVPMRNELMPSQPGRTLGVEMPDHSSHIPSPFATRQPDQNIFVSPPPYTPYNDHGLFSANTRQLAVDDDDDMPPLIESTESRDTFNEPFVDNEIEYKDTYPDEKEMKPTENPLTSVKHEPKVFSHPEPLATAMAVDAEPAPITAIPVPEHSLPVHATPIESHATPANNEKDSDDDDSEDDVPDLHEPDDTPPLLARGIAGLGGLLYSGVNKTFNAIDAYSREAAAREAAVREAAAREAEAHERLEREAAAREAAAHKAAAAAEAKKTQHTNRLINEFNDPTTSLNDKRQMAIKYPDLFEIGPMGNPKRRTAPPPAPALVAPSAPPPPPPPVASTSASAAAVPHHVEDLRKEDYVAKYGERYIEPAKHQKYPSGLFKSHVTKAELLNRYESLGDANPDHLGSNSTVPVLKYLIWEKMGKPTA